MRRTSGLRPADVRSRQADLRCRQPAGDSHSVGSWPIWTMLQRRRYALKLSLRWQRQWLSLATHHRCTWPDVAHVNWSSGHDVAWQIDWT